MEKEKKVHCKKKKHLFGPQNLTHLGAILKISLGGCREFGFRKNPSRAFCKCPNEIVHHSFQTSI